VHRKHFLERQQIIHDGEDGFLDLAGIFGAADQHDAFLKIDDDKGRGVRPVPLRVGSEKRGIDNGEFRLEILGSFFRYDKEIAREEVVPGKFGDDANRQPVAFVGADEAV
jgi:hypothetical protein